MGWVRTRWNKSDMGAEEWEGGDIRYEIPDRGGKPAPYDGDGTAIRRTVEDDKSLQGKRGAVCLIRRRWLSLPGGRPLAAPTDRVPHSL